MNAPNHNIIEGAVLEGPHWTEPVRVLSVKPRAKRLEIHAIGVYSRQHTAKLIPLADIERTVKVSPPSERAALDGNPMHFRLAAEAHRIRLAYPFHPELISALYERWGSIPEFERTRGVLRLLAFMISQLYRAKDNGYVIQSGDVDLGSVEVRPELIKFIGNQFHGVIDTDIAGKDAKAPEIDRQLGSEYAKESVSEKLAKAIFMYSFGGGAQRGATLPQLRVAVLNPDMPPPFMSDAADRLTKRLWHLYHDSGLFYFDAQANLNRILIDREEMVRSEPDKVQDFCKSVLNNMIGDQAIRVFRYPQEDRDVADQPQLGRGGSRRGGPGGCGRRSAGIPGYSGRNGRREGRQGRLDEVPSLP